MEDRRNVDKGIQVMTKLFVKDFRSSSSAYSMPVTRKCRENYGKVISTKMLLINSQKHLKFFISQVVKKEGRQHLIMLTKWKSWSRKIKS